MKLRGMGIILVICIGIVCGNGFRRHIEKQRLYNAVTALPAVESATITDSDEIFSFYNYFALEITLKNGDSFYIKSVKSDLSFYKRTRLLIINGVEVYHVVGAKLFSLCIPLKLLGIAYGTDMTDLTVFLAEYRGICNFLNNPTVADITYKNNDGDVFWFGRYADAYIPVH